MVPEPPLSSRQPVTLAEVARTAAVSSMTVSRVVNGDPRVSASTCERVKSAITRLGYRPPPAELDGRRRRSRAHLGLHTGRVAVLMPDLTLTSLSTPLSARWLRGLDRPLIGTGMQVIITRLPGPNILPPWINRRHIDGLIIRAPTQGQPWLAQAVRHLALVWIFDPGPAVTVGDIINVDDEQIGRELGQRVKAQNRGPVLILDNQPDNIAHRRRLAGLASIIGADQIIQPSIVAPPAQILAQHPGVGTIFLPGTGVTLAQAVSELRRRPLNERPWIVSCCHDRAILSSLDIPITNIDIRPEELGEQAAQQVLARVSDPGAPRAKIMIPHVWEEGPFAFE